MTQLKIQTQTELLRTQHLLTEIFLLPNLDLFALDISGIISLFILFKNFHRYKLYLYTFGLKTRNLGKPQITTHLHNSVCVC